MDRKQVRILGIVAWVVCGVCIFTAIERYQANANNVRAFSQIQNAMPTGDAHRLVSVRPSIPAITKYAILFAIISGVTGFVLMAKTVPPSMQTKSPDQPPAANG